MIKFFLVTGYILETAILSPSMVVVFFIFYFAKNQDTADEIAEKLIDYKITWAFSLLVWFCLYLIIKY